MKKCTLSRAVFSKVILASSIALAASTQAADISINGFISVVAGKTISEGKQRVDPTSAAASSASYTADGPTEGAYDDDISFKPDSVYGLQFRSDLGKGLAVTGQITGHGGEDYEANVSWAYISYQLNDEWSLQAGRQRLPLFYYSDFLDVGYAYHWIRIPQELPAAFVDTFEGLKVSWTPSTDNWDWRIDLYGGSGSEEFTDPVDFDVDFEGIAGAVVQVGNDWLQLRATYMTTEAEVSAPIFSRMGTVQGTSDNPIAFDFAGVAAHMTFDNVFVVAEYTMTSLDDPLGTDQLAGNDGSDVWYLSMGIRLGDFTPHITYTVSDETMSDEVVGLSSDADNSSETWTLGVRWDFHPNAALKVEYLTRSDESDSVLKDSVGGFGYGDRNEVDLMSVGVDVIF